MRLINKTLFFIFLVVGTLLRAETIPDVPAPAPPGGGGGGVGPGGIASPVDMYVYALIIVAFLFIVYFSRKHQKSIV